MQIFNLTRLPAFALFCAALVVSACSKQAPIAESSTPAESQTANQPTGLVKNPVKQNHAADVTKWMDQAGTKTTAQIAQEEKLAREAKEKLAQEARDKLAQEAKRAQELKQAAAAKAAPPVKETPAAVAAAPVKAVETHAAPESAKVAAAPVATPKPAEPENISLKLLSGAQPKYPNTAARAGITEGRVNVKINVEPDGHVSKVEILNARPVRVFDKEVIATVSQWKYAPISRPYSTNFEFNFKLE